MKITKQSIYYTGYVLEEKNDYVINLHNREVSVYV